MDEGTEMQDGTPVMRTLLLASLAVALTGASSAEACSCIKDTSSIRAQLEKAKADAEAIFLARVESSVERPEAKGKGDVFLTRLTILERYKGDVGATLQMPSGWSSGDCTFHFDVGREYLVYAKKDSGVLGTSHCTRSREVTRRDDAELTWLRTGAPVPLPVVLQRELVSCAPCSLEAVAAAMPTDGGALPLLDEAPARVAWKAKRPFWVRSSYDYEHRGVRFALGSAPGQAFELRQSPWTDSRETCRQKVERRWCKAVRPAKRARWLLQFECVGPGPFEVVCDADAARTVTVSAPEALAAVTRCEWELPDELTCHLSATAVALDGGVPAGASLRCLPEYDGLLGDDGRTGRHRCRIEPDAGSSP